MSVLERLQRALASGSEARGPALSMLRGIQPGGVGTPPERGTQQRLEAYRSHPWARTTVGHIADGVAGVTWRLYAVGSEGSRARREPLIQRGAYAVRKAHLEARRRAGELREIREHLFLDLVGRGNGEYTGWQLRKLLSAQYELSGEAYALIQRNGAGRPESLWSIPAHWVRSTPTPDKPVYCVSWRGWQVDVPARQMLWHKDPNPADPYGRGAAMVAALADELDTDEYMAKTLRQWFFNFARPDVLVTVEGATQTEVDRLERTWIDRLAGMWRRWRPLFLRGKVGIHEFDQDFRSQQMVQLRSHSQDVILQAMGFPPEVVGRLQNCLDDQTECLTRRGWIRQDALTESDEIATWDDELGRLEYHRPSAIFRYEHDGPMHYWTGRVNFACTPGHRLWVKHGRRRGEREGWRFAESQEVGSWTSAYWRTTGGGFEGHRKQVVLPETWHGNATPGSVRHRATASSAIELDVHVVAPFLGYWLAEGWASRDGDRAYHVYYSQNLGPVADSMRAAMEDLGLSRVYERVRQPDLTHRRPNPAREMRMAHKGLWTWLMREAGHGAHHKRIPEEVFEWPRSAQMLLFRAFIQGDGSVSDHRSPVIHIGSRSEKLIDGLQRLAVHLGVRAYKSGTAETLWTLIVTQGPYQALDRYGSPGSQASWVEARYYRGTVWCVEVENHRFFTRRGGRVACHGNSNRATIVAANFLMGRYVLQPRLEAWRACWQRFAEQEYDERIIVDYDSPIDEDKDFQLDAMKAMPYAFEVDEIRALAGHPAKENGSGKVHAVPLNLQLVPGDLIAPPPMPRAPAPAPPPPAAAPKMLSTADAGVCAQAGDLASERAILKALAGDAEDLPALTRLATRMEPALARAFLEAAASVGAPDLEALAVAVAAGDVGAAEAAVRLTEIEQRLGQTLPPVMRQGFTAGARFAADALALEGLRFDVIDQGAVTWARARAAGLVVEIGAETRQTIQRLIAEALSGMRDTRSTARLLRDVIGLTSRQADAVARFEARLRDQGADRIESRVQRYADAQRRLRASMIARTEISTASHQGQRALWQAGVEQGQLDPERTRRVWMVTPDDRLDTEICEPLDGVEAGLNEAFPGGYMDPPTHPNCRCTVGLRFIR